MDHAGQRRLSLFFEIDVTDLVRPVFVNAHIFPPDPAIIVTQRKPIVKTLKQEGSSKKRLNLEEIKHTERTFTVFMQMPVLYTKTDEYISYWNNKRISLKLKGMSPVQYRTHCQTI